jgi:hypothetical protein
MKRTPLKRGKGLARSGRLRRTAKLRAKGKSRFPKRRDPAYIAWIHTQPCILYGNGGTYGVPLGHRCISELEACHVRSRGAGGDDRANVVPMCRILHQQQHTWGIKTFEAFWRIDLAAEAKRLFGQYQREVGS